MYKKQFHFLWLLHLLLPRIVQNQNKYFRYPRVRMVANMTWKKNHVKEVDHKPVLKDFKKQLNYCERKAEAKTEEEGGVKAKKQAIRALRDRARYLEKKMAIAVAINPNTKDLEHRWSFSEWS